MLVSPLTVLNGNADLSICRKRAGHAWDCLMISKCLESMNETAIGFGLVKDRLFDDFYVPWIGHLMFDDDFLTGLSIQTEELLDVSRRELAAVF